MPINPDQVTDKNALRYSLPVDSCVGDAGPSPEQARMISRGGGRDSGLSRTTLTGGPTSTQTAQAFGKSAGRSPSQGGPVPVGFDPDYTSDNNYSR